MKLKFTVLKNEDIMQHLSNFDRKDLIRILTKIEKGRQLAGKTASNMYLIINTDEPYADKIIEIMKENNHWEG